MSDIDEDRYSFLEKMLVTCMEMNKNPKMVEKGIDIINAAFKLTEEDPKLMAKIMDVQIELLTRNMQPLPIFAAILPTTLKVALEPLKTPEAKAEYLKKVDAISFQQLYHVIGSKQIALSFFALAIELAILCYPNEKT
jgi:hypothetical protein